jgi:hypothetical protein
MTLEFHSAADLAAHYAALDARLGKHKRRAPIEIPARHAALPLPPALPKSTAESPLTCVGVTPSSLPIATARPEPFDFNGPPRVRAIIEACAAHFEVSAASVVGPRRFAKSARARQLASYVLTAIVRFSTLRVGKFLNRDHTSVVHGRDKVAAWLEDGSITMPDFEALGIDLTPLKENGEYRPRQRSFPIDRWADFEDRVFCGEPFILAELIALSFGKNKNSTAARLAYWRERGMLKAISARVGKPAVWSLTAAGRDFAEARRAAI